MEAATVARLGLSLENVDDHMMFVVLAVKLVLALLNTGRMYSQCTDKRMFHNLTRHLTLTQVRV